MLMGYKAMAGVRKTSGKVKNEVKDNRPIMFFVRCVLKS